MTLAQLQDEVLFRLGRVTATDPTFNDRITTRLNWANQSMAQQLRPAEFEETTTVVLSSTPTVILPTDLIVVMGLKLIEDARPIVIRHLQTDLGIFEDEYGEPTTAFRFGQTLDLRPIPSTDWLTSTRTLRIYYIKKPQTITSNVANPMPDYLEEGTILGAIYRMHRDMNAVERSKMAFVEWQGFMRSINNQRGEELQYMGGRSTTALRLDGSY